jgi:YgiT-type zinc finger domain-containing protein
MIKITVCPNCGSEKLKKVCQDWTGNYRGQTYIVPELEYYECPNCGEKLYDRAAMRKIEAYSPAFAHLHPEKELA